MPPPLPGAAFTTGVRLKRWMSKAAPVLLFASTDRVHEVLGFWAAQAPVHPAKLDPWPAAAVRVMEPGMALETTWVVHALPQLMAPPVTVPLPVPELATVTVKVCWPTPVGETLTCVV